MNLFHSFARFEIFPLAENGNGGQEAKFGIVHFHLDHASAKSEESLKPETGLLVVLFSERMVIGKDDGLCLRIVPEIEKKVVVSVYVFVCGMANRHQFS